MGEPDDLPGHGHVRPTISIRGRHQDSLHLGGQRQGLGQAPFTSHLPFPGHTSRKGHLSPFGGTWMGVPAATSAASTIASERVGWGWIVTSKSSRLAPISRARVASAISSDA
jgi:hypothetical protein